MKCKFYLDLGNGKLAFEGERWVSERARGFLPVAWIVTELNPMLFSLAVGPVKPVRLLEYVRREWATPSKYRDGFPREFRHWFAYVRKPEAGRP